jgi:3',5'-cyclic AMP phosphodiesterase CpdA
VTGAVPGPGDTAGPTWPLTIAHLSDLHIGAHSPLAAERLVADVTAAGPTVTVLTGDLTMRARRTQFAGAAALVDRLPGPRLLVPGNHDITLTNPIARLLFPDERYRSGLHAPTDPTLALPGLRILGINSMPRWRWKSGRVTRRQCERVTEFLGGAPSGAVRVLVLHHPLQPTGLAGLAGRRRLMRAVCAAGVDIVLCGHTHVPASRRMLVAVHHRAHRFVEVVAGTATSTRLRGADRSWSLVRVWPQSIRVDNLGHDDRGPFVQSCQRYPGPARKGSPPGMRRAATEREHHRSMATDRSGNPLRRLALAENYRPDAARPRKRVDPGRLWAGGAATALVTAGIATAGILLMRGVFDIDVIVPKLDGGWHQASIGQYALGAALASLAATALMQVLILFTPRPARFFAWIVTMATLVAMTLPFVTSATIESTLTTSGLNLLLGLAIGSLIAGTARSAVSVAESGPLPPYGTGPGQL